MAVSVEKQLEHYTLQYPQEVLLVTAEIAGEIDKVLIFRGFSSSLVRSTATDPDIPVLPDSAVNITIDRLTGPYNPNAPNYLERQISWDTFAQRLTNP